MKFRLLRTDYDGEEVEVIEIEAQDNNDAVEQTENLLDHYDNQGILFNEKGWENLVKAVKGDMCPDCKIGLEVV